MDDERDNVSHLPAPAFSSPHLPVSLHSPVEGLKKPSPLPAVDLFDRRWRGLWSLTLVVTIVTIRRLMSGRRVAVAHPHFIGDFSGAMSRGRGPGPGPGPGLIRNWLPYTNHQLPTTTTTTTTCGTGVRLVGLVGLC